MKIKEKFNIVVNEHSVWIRELHLSDDAFRVRMRYDKHASVCPLCRQEMVSGNDTYVIITNYRLFPNTSIHLECKTQDWPTIIKQLETDWKAAKLDRELNRCWFGWPEESVGREVLSV